MSHDSSPAIGERAEEAHHRSDVRDEEEEYQSENDPRLNQDARVTDRDGKRAAGRTGAVDFTEQSSCRDSERGGSVIRRRRTFALGGSPPIRRGTSTS